MDTEEYQEIKEPKQSYKKKYVIIVIVCIIVCFFLVLLWWNMQMESGSIEFANRVKISDNLYYDEDNFKQHVHEGDEENILADYRLLSKHFTDSYPYQVFYVEDFEYYDHKLYDTNEDVSDVIYYGSQIIDGAIVDGTTFSLAIRNDKILDFDYDYNTQIVYDAPKLDRRISAEEAMKKAKRIAKDNENIMHESVSDIECSYELRYSNKNGFYYCIYFGHWGCLGKVVISAKTGKVLLSEFSNGLEF